MRLFDYEAPGKSEFWGKPGSGPVGPVVTEFEKTAEEYKLTPDQYLQSSQLREWAPRNKNSKLIPEPLLKAWDRSTGQVRAKGTQVQTSGLEMSKDLSDALSNRRESFLFRDPGNEGLLDYDSGRARDGFGATRGGRKKTEPMRGHRNGRPGQYGQRETSDVATRPLGHCQKRRSPGIFLLEFVRV